MKQRPCEATQVTENRKRNGKQTVSQMAQVLDLEAFLRMRRERSADEFFAFKHSIHFDCIWKRKPFDSVAVAAANRERKFGGSSVASAESVESATAAAAAAEKLALAHITVCVCVHGDSSERSRAPMNQPLTPFRSAQLLFGLLCSSCDAFVSAVIQRKACTWQMASVANGKRVQSSLRMLTVDGDYLTLLCMQTFRKFFPLRLFFFFFLFAELVGGCFGLAVELLGMHMQGKYTSSTQTDSNGDDGLASSWWRTLRNSWGGDKRETTATAQSRHDSI